MKMITIRTTIATVTLSLFAAAAGAAPAQPVKNIVLVHGAFADGSSWAKVIPILQALQEHYGYLPEEALRRAYGRADADPRVRQNLGLVIGLQGRLAEAESIVRADRPAAEAAANVEYLKRLLSRKESSRKDADNKPAKAGMPP
jgi:pimeloyl-ACP methyl ester carboxylesterase